MPWIPISVQVFAVQSSCSTIGPTRFTGVVPRFTVIGQTGEIGVLRFRGSRILVGSIRILCVRECLPFTDFSGKNISINNKENRSAEP